MATTHKLMANGQLADSAASIYNPSSVTGLVKMVVLHNTNSSAEIVEIFHGSTAAADKMLKVSIAADETFEWSLGHMVVVLDAEQLYGNAETASKVNYFIFGAEEA